MANVVDRVMQRWADHLRRRGLCAWCRDGERDPATSQGRYCSFDCQVADAKDQEDSLM